MNYFLYQFYVGITIQEKLQIYFSNSLIEFENFYY